MQAAELEKRKRYTLDADAWKAVLAAPTSRLSTSQYTGTTMKALYLVALAHSLHRTTASGPGPRTRRSKRSAQRSSQRMRGR